MKNLLTTFLVLLATLGINAQSLIGAWQHTKKLDNGQDITSVLIVTEGYQVMTTYDAKDGTIIQTNGGSWSLEGNTMTETVEFHTIDPEMVGKTVSFDIKLTKDTVQMLTDLP